MHIYTSCTTIVPSNIYHHGPQKSHKFHDVYVGLVIVKFSLDFQQQKGFFLQKLMRFRKEEIKKHRQKLYFYGFFDSILRSSSKYLIAISISIYFSRWPAHRINELIKNHCLIFQAAGWISSANKTFKIASVFTESRSPCNIVSLCRTVLPTI